jgi:probable rRNA maturation factor
LIENCKLKILVMQVEVILNEKEICGVSSEEMRRIVFESIVRSGIAVEGKYISVGVASVTLAEMQALNERYRKKDAPTDVLSFPEYAGRTVIETETKSEISLGDIVLSCDIVRSQAKEDGVSTSRELAYLLSHGVLHLLGYNHEPEMFSIQDEICDILGE